MKKRVKNVEISLLTNDNYAELKDVMISSEKPTPNACWTEQQIATLISKFPEGQVVIKVGGKIAGWAFSIIVDSNRFENNHTYEGVITGGTFDSHLKTGDVLYGIDVFIKPEYRGNRLGRRLYEYRKELCERLNLKGIIFGGRIPNYHTYADKLNPKEYIEKVRTLEIHDPVLNFQLSNDFHVIRIMKNYLEEDAASMGFAILLKWVNIYYEKTSFPTQINKTIVRLGLVQWQMRPYNGLKELMDQAEYFIDALSAYKSDFALFPEIFNAPLMAAYDNLSEAAAIRKLAEYTDEIVKEFSRLAVAYNINVITGSMPEVRDGILYNIGYLCRRDGSIDSFEKIHVTPNEKREWGMTGGNKINIFETDAGKIGILICYDVEFPELGRLLAAEGMEILFVPFLTDTQNGYSRVKNCAQARAIENECYVAIAGSVGNLPKVQNMGIQYAQSMVFTPCDFSFTTNGIKAEATPNTEMILVSDVDLDLLRELHNHGDVQNLKDRRNDIYTLSKT